jgi:hypothetical protein
MMFMAMPLMASWPPIPMTAHLDVHVDGGSALTLSLEQVLQISCNALHANVRVLCRKNSACIGRKIERRRALHPMASPIAEDLAMLWIDMAKPAVLNDGPSNHGALNDRLEVRGKPPLTGRQIWSAGLEHLAAFLRRRLELMWGWRLVAAASKDRLQSTAVHT